MISMIQNLL